MNQVIKILMERDGNTKEEAESRLTECRHLCNECLAADDYEGAEDTIMRARKIRLPANSVLKWITYLIFWDSPQASIFVF